MFKIKFNQVQCLHSFAKFGINVHWLNMQ
uniref:Uncharacterized protein n=1 Tax=Anguilla anguilla TaxID=7936 RepID=A0A0E9QVF1_ANGAN